MADEDEGEFEVAPPSKLPMVLGIIAAFIVGGGGSAIYFGSAEPAAAKTEAAEGEAAEGEEGEPGEPGGNERIVFSLESFNVNLRGAGGGRVLRMEVQLEIRKKDEQHIQRAVPRLRTGFDARIRLHVCRPRRS